MVHSVATLSCVYRCLRRYVVDQGAFAKVLAGTQEARPVLAWSSLLLLTVKFTSFLWYDVRWARWRRTRLLHKILIPHETPSVVFVDHVTCTLTRMQWLGHFKLWLVYHVFGCIRYLCWPSTSHRELIDVVAESLMAFRSNLGVHLRCGKAWLPQAACLARWRCQSTCIRCQLPKVIIFERIRRFVTVTFARSTRPGVEYWLGALTILEVLRAIEGLSVPWIRSYILQNVIGEVLKDAVVWNLQHHLRIGLLSILDVL